MAFIYYDDAKGIFAVVLRQETCKAFVIIQTQCLIGGYVNASIGSSVASLLGLHNTNIIAEGRFELGVGLLAQFVAITQEQGRFRKLSGLAETP